MSLAVFGSSTGCGFFLLKKALENNVPTVALLRSPKKLTDKLSETEISKVKIVEGNAHDLNCVKQSIVDPNDSTKFVSTVVSAIGGLFNIKNFTIDDPHVCENGIKTLIKAINELKSKGIKGDPKIIVLSTTGISKFQRDIPILMIPLYKLLLNQAHEDKKVLEDETIHSGLKFTIVRPSLLTDGEEPNPIRIGIEDPVKGVEKKEIGYTISRKDVGHFIYDNLTNYDSKIVSITN